MAILTNFRQFVHLKDMVYNFLLHFAPSTITRISLSLKKSFHLIEAVLYGTENFVGLIQDGLVYQFTTVTGKIMYDTYKKINFFE